jgi:hypothetical protein
MASEAELDAFARAGKAATVDRVLSDRAEFIKLDRTYIKRALSF